MEEKLDKLISLMEMQNKAWEKCLELLFSLAETMTADRKNKELLLEKHPAPRPTPSSIAESANIYNDRYRYGTELEEGPQPEPIPSNQQQSAPPEAPPEVPVTSKAEMMEQAEKRE